MTEITIFIEGINILSKLKDIPYDKNYEPYKRTLDLNAKMCVTEHYIEFEGSSLDNICKALTQTVLSICDSTGKTKVYRMWNLLVLNELTNKSGSKELDSNIALFVKKQTNYASIRIQYSDNSSYIFDITKLRTEYCNA